MPETPVLMENTKINSFSIWNERVYNRNKRFFRPVFKREVTAAMCKSAAISVPDYVMENAAPAVEAPAVEAPAVEAPSEVEEVALPPRPVTTDWSEEQLKEYIEGKDIPYHPQAKVPGLQSAITRYHDELEVQAEG